MSDILDGILGDTPADEQRLFDLCDEIGDRIEAAMKTQDGGRGWTQRQLAEALGKKESYVSRALAGGVNFTLRTIAQFEIALGVSLIATTDLHEGTAPFYGPSVLHQPRVHLTVGASERPVRRHRPGDRVSLRLVAPGAVPMASAA